MNGTPINVADKFIPENYSVPIPAAGGAIPANLGGGTIGGSPTLPNMIYEYHQMPSGGGILGAMQTLLGGFWGKCKSKAA